MRLNLDEFFYSMCNCAGLLVLVAGEDIPHNVVVDEQFIVLVDRHLSKQLLAALNFGVEFKHQLTSQYWLVMGDIRQITEH